MNEIGRVKKKFISCKVYVEHFGVLDLPWIDRLGNYAITNKMYPIFKLPRP